MTTEVVLLETLATSNDLLIGVATLNLPQSLNALNLAMIKRLASALTAWADDPRVVCVVLRGAGEKAFCAGGDVRSLYAAAKRSQDDLESYSRDCAEFFIHEYQLDYQIHCYSKPLLCLGHGVVMGGGLGLMVGASHRVITDKANIAMPEITIGLFPDVGGTYFLPRLPGLSGLYLGLTATRLNAADGLYAGLADYVLTLPQLPDLLTQLTLLPWQTGKRAGNDQLLHQLLRSVSAASALPVAVSPLREHQAFIDEVCRGADLAAFAARLAATDPADKWIQAGKKAFFGGSPSSAALIFEQYEVGRGIALAAAFQFELNVATRRTSHPDFVEGVRALLIDKDQAPAWSPAKLAGLSPADLAVSLEPLWSVERHPLRHFR